MDSLSFGLCTSCPKHAYPTSLWSRSRLQCSMPIAGQAVLYQSSCNPSHQQRAPLAGSQLHTKFAASSQKTFDSTVQAQLAMPGQAYPKQCCCWSNSMLVQGSLPKLQQLDLSGNILSSEAMSCLAQAQWPSLTKLDLRQTFGFQSPHGEVLLSCSHLASSSWPKLMVLDLSDNLLAVDSVAELIKANRPELTNLSIMKCFVDRQASATACSYLGLQTSWPMVSVLTAGGNLFAPGSISALLRGQ